MIPLIIGSINTRRQASGSHVAQEALGRWDQAVT